MDKAKTINENIINTSKHSLNYENLNFDLLLSITNSKELIIKMNQTNIMANIFYTCKLNFEDFTKIDKLFRAYDTINEIYEILNDTIKTNQAIIKKIEDENFNIIFNFMLPGNRQKDITINLKKKYIEQKDLNIEVITKVNNLELKYNSEYSDLKKDIKENKETINDLKNKMDGLGGDMNLILKFLKELKHKDYLEKEKMNQIIKEKERKEREEMERLNQIKKN